jgi:hypothetical protein
MSTVKIRAGSLFHTPLSRIGAGSARCGGKKWPAVRVQWSEAISRIALKGRGFSRAAQSQEMTRASAPEERSHPTYEMASQELVVSVQKKTLKKNAFD